jgi:hypothetical protein
VTVVLQGGGMTHIDIADYLRDMARARTPLDLTQLAERIRRAWPDDEATPRLVGIIAYRREYMARLN